MLVVAGNMQAPYRLQISIYMCVQQILAIKQREEPWMMKLPCMPQKLSLKDVPYPAYECVYAVNTGLT